MARRERQTDNREGIHNPHLVPLPRATTMPDPGTSPVPVCCGWERGVGGGLEFSPTRGFPPEGEGLHTGGGGPGKAQAATPAPFATWTSSLRTPTGSSSRCPAAGIQPPFPGNPSRSFTERVRFADPPHLLVAGPRKVVCCLSHL